MKKNKTRQKFSPKNYIINKGRTFPIYKCMVTDNYKVMGLTICLLVRRQPNGKFMFASFVVDRHCLGVKDTVCDCNLDDKAYQELIDRYTQIGQMEEVDQVYFHNLIYAAIDYADELGFKPHKDFNLAEHILDSDLIDDGIDDIELGHEGKPLFFAGPFDDSDKIIAKLDRQLGKDKYHFVIKG